MIYQEINKKILKKIKTIEDYHYKDQIIDIWKKNFFIQYKNNGLILPFKIKWSFNDNNFIFNKSFSNYYLLFKKIESLIEENKYRDLKKTHFFQKEIQDSLWIERVYSSKKKIETTLKKNTPKNKLENFIVNYKNALLFIENEKNINEKTFNQLYKILTKNIDMGPETLEENSLYRKGEVTIGNQDGLKANKIKIEMDKIFEKLNNSKPESEFESFLNAITLHYLFERIHPYYDFNGRIGRLLVQWYAKKNDIFQFFEYFSSAIELFKVKLYYKAFKKTQNNIYEYDLSYFVASIMSAMLAYNICYYISDVINKNVLYVNNTKLNTFEKEIIIKLLSKNENEFTDNSEFIKNVKDYDPAIISRSLKKLVKLKILKVSNLTKPKKYIINLDYCLYFQVRPELRNTKYTEETIIMPIAGLIYDIINEKW